MFVYIFSAATFGKYWDNFGTTLGPHWDFWTTLRQLLASSVIFETTLRQGKDNIETALAPHVTTWWLLTERTSLISYSGCFPLFPEDDINFKRKKKWSWLTVDKKLLLCVESKQRLPRENTRFWATLSLSCKDKILFVKTMILRNQI